ncbi:hypothetical protein DM01DRAFT_1340835 [Hesseltinella vesiculosa]|uniref:SET domain-containing protein n=1 Tax=Hesseltinella vesiculosa TaxID=101127 RepID=A0A1X2G2W9_9FUNG|nr:hypothetical protein DM01DRAFT_1340835 [Hesseltinella vesiculosa]
MLDAAKYNLSTVVNQNQFLDAVDLEVRSIVGRTLVAKRALVPGESVLVEQPLLQYFLQPSCRSSLSPYYTKAMWKQLNKYVVELDQDQSSPFVPGLPAATLAYLQIDPPPLRQRIKRTPSVDHADLDFFYYPNLDMDHPTVQLIVGYCRNVTCEIALFQHVEAEQLATFLLKIYGNAHTVALDRQSLARKGCATTHSAKKHRRSTTYADRYQSAPWPPSPLGPRPSIALMTWGSKFTHSCSPNLLLHFDNASNTMTFTVTRPVTAGEVLTFSYLPENDDLGGLICGTTRDRRRKLNQFKFFDCGCDRCNAKDINGRCNCSTCDSDAVTSFNGLSGAWQCDRCGSTELPEFLLLDKGEAYASSMVTALATKLRDPDQAGEVVTMIEPYLMEDLIPTLPRTHWTFGYAQGLLAWYHLDLLPSTFGTGLASQLNATSSGLREASVFLNDYLHDALWSSNPLPVFMASWMVLSPVIQAVTRGTEEKQYRVQEKVLRQRSDSDDSSSDEDEAPEAPELLAPLVLPMPEEWQKDVLAIHHTVMNLWLPTVNAVFQQPPALIADRIRQIQQWSLRIQESMAL